MKYLIATFVLLGILAGCGEEWTVPPPLVGAPPPVWNGIVLGKSTSADTAKSLEDDVFIDTTDSRFPTGYSIRRFVVAKDVVAIWFKYDPTDTKDKVQYIQIEKWPKSGDSLLNVINQIGKPEKIDWSDFGKRVYIFASRGLVIDAKGDVITRVEYFLPTTSDAYITSWGKITPRGKAKDDLEPLDPLHILTP